MAVGAGVECDAIDQVRVGFVFEVLAAVRKLTLAGLLE